MTAADMTDPPQPPSAAPSRRRLSPRARSWIEWAVVIVGALAVSFGVRAYLIQTFMIPSASMVPTLEVGDRILVNKLADDLEGLDRGEIVVFEKPPELQSDLDHLVKRVIGLPGETIEARDRQILIDGVPIDEPWLPPGVGTDDFGPVEVPEGELFFMGDNRSQSQDSRYFGTVDASFVVGEVFLRIWPPSRVGTP